MSDRKASTEPAKPAATTAPAADPKGAAPPAAAPAGGEPEMVPVTFTAHYLSFSPGETAMFTPEHAAALKEAGVAGGEPGDRPLYRQDHPPGASPSPKDYDPQHQDVDPNRPGNYATRQHQGAPGDDPATRGRATRP